MAFPVECYDPEPPNLISGATWSRCHVSLTHDYQGLQIRDPFGVLW